jgi:hypothetical protein
MRLYLFGDLLDLEKRSFKEMDIDPMTYKNRKKEEKELKGKTNGLLQNSPKSPPSFLFPLFPWPKEPSISYRDGPPISLLFFTFYF